MPSVDLTRLPRHVAIVMDGNGRWAEQLGRPRTDGHREGSESVRRIVRASRRLGISALTLYAFSEQNWARPREEVDALMLLLREFLLSERQELVDHRISLRAIGRVHKLPPHVREVLDEIVSATAASPQMTLTLALSYGGREEIVDAVASLAREIEAGELRAAAVDERALERHLPSMEHGPVDLLVRTGGEQRISNFLLWASAYSELYFSAALWPDWSADELYEAIHAFQSRDRRFGRAKSDLALRDERVALTAATSAHV